MVQVDISGYRYPDETRNAFHEYLLSALYRLLESLEMSTENKQFYAGCSAIVTTPCLGYWKNLALSDRGHMSKHLTALWDNGLIKFYSKAKLVQLLREACFVDMHFVRVGWVPVLTKSMIVIAIKP